MAKRTKKMKNCSPVAPKRNQDERNKEEKKKAPEDPQPQKRQRKRSPTEDQSDDCGEGMSYWATQQKTEPDSDPQRDERNKEEKKKAPKDPQPQKRKRKMSPTEDQSDDCSEGTSQQGTQQKTEQDSDPQRAAFLDKYQELHALGEGAFGTVFAGHRRSDNLPVAIKHIIKKDVDRRHTCDDGQRVPMEVAIMMKLKSVGSSGPISLLDWYEPKQELILVLERPVPCVDLFEYIENNGGCLSESKAKIIMKQLVDVAKELEDHGIFHRDIKVENILIETDSDVLRARLIDFGLGCFTKPRSIYRLFRGTPIHIPPEAFWGEVHRAGPSTVWQLGVALFDILHTDERFETKKFLAKKLKFTAEVSGHCMDFLNKCLTLDDRHRATLEELRRHRWLMVASALTPLTSSF